MYDYKTIGRGIQNLARYVQKAKSSDECDAYQSNRALQDIITFALYRLGLAAGSGDDTHQAVNQVIREKKR
jgi:hypothetical protein